MENIPLCLTSVSINENGKAWLTLSDDKGFWNIEISPLVFVEMLGQGKIISSDNFKEKQKSFNKEPEYYQLKSNFDYNDILDKIVNEYLIKIGSVERKDEIEHDFREGFKAAFKIVFY